MGSYLGVSETQSSFESSPFKESFMDDPDSSRNGQVDTKDQPGVFNLDSLWQEAKEKHSY